MSVFPIFVIPKPGISRDGTAFESSYCTDGQWVRFYPQPRKIGGYKLIMIGTDGVMRSMFSVPKQNGTLDIYCGYTGSIKVLNIDSQGNPTGNFIDRTPSGFIASPSNQWSFDIYNFQTPDSQIIDSYVVAQVCETENNISSSAVGPIYYGLVDFDSSNQLMQPIPQGTGNLEVSGGVISMPPYLMAYGNSGGVSWNDPADNATLGNWGNFKTITGNKIIQAGRTRGGGTLAALFWSINSLNRATVNYTADPADAFSFEVVAENITVISASSIVKVNDLYYWIGQGQFYLYNGTVQTLNNVMNANYFFSRVNMNAAQNIWGIYVARYKEIWWFYPSGDSTECTDVIIYHTVLDTWYDTVCSRSCGDPGYLFQHPIMASPKPLSLLPNIDPSPGNTPLFFHEWGFDLVLNASSYAIESYVETNVTMVSGSTSTPDSSYLIQRIEPDVLATGVMTLTVNQRAYPQSIPVVSQPYEFYGQAEGQIGTTRIDLNQQARFFSLTFKSNTPGGYYQLGKSIVDIDMGATRPVSGISK